MTTNEIAAMFDELSKENQEKFITFLNRLLSSEAPTDTTPPACASPPANR